jgi:hypothetical protein
VAEGGGAELVFQVDDGIQLCFASYAGVTLRPT